MKELMSTILLVSALALASPAVAGHGADRQEGHHGARSMAGGDLSATMIHRLVRAIHNLDLTEQQKEGIHAIFQESREDLKANRQAAAERRKQLHGILTAETLDEEALANVARQEGDLLTERIMIAGSVASKVFAQLDQAQRAELEAMAEKHRQHLGEHRDRRGDHNF